MADKTDKHVINDLMATTMSKIREMVDVNTIVGQAIDVGDVTIIPVSRVSFGFGSGGSDLPAKNLPADRANPFGGGSGAGVSIVPIGFLIIKGDSVRMIPVAQPASSTADRVIDMIPDVVDKISAMIPKKDKQEEPAEEE